MRPYKKSPKDQLRQMKEWIAQNPQGKLVDFLEATKGTATQFYHIRRSLGMAKITPPVSEGLKKSHAKKKAKPSTQHKVETVKTEESALGIVGQLDALGKGIDNLKVLIQKVVGTNIQLRVNNRSLENQLSKLREVINGSPV